MRCTAKTLAGNICKKNALEGKSLCWIHQEQRKSKSERGRSIERKPKPKKKLDERNYPKYEYMILNAMSTRYGKAKISEIVDDIYLFWKVPETESSKVQITLALLRGLTDGLWTKHRITYNLTEKGEKHFKNLP